MSKTRIAFIGAGNMAASLIGGLRAQGLDASQIRASDPGAETRSRIQAEHGIETFEDNAQAIDGADVIVLAVKPQVMKAVCQALQPSLRDGQLIVSIAAGITCASLQLVGARPWCAMPRAPAPGRERPVRHRRGVRRTAPAGRATAVGGRHGLWLEQEQQLDAVTAVSGSGPAYFFLLIEAMTAAGESLGCRVKPPRN